MTMNVFRGQFCLVDRAVLFQIRPDDGGRRRYEVPRSVVDVQLPAFSATVPRRYAVDITNQDRFAFQVIRNDTGTVLYVRMLFITLSQFSLSRDA